MGAEISVACDHCGEKVLKSISALNRSIKQGAKVYCSKKCAGLARRHNKTEDQKKEEKRLYDIEYRAKNLAEIKQKKAAWFQANYDPVKAAIDRAKRMPQHVEYCRRPEYKEYKRKYDQRYQAGKQYGEFAEAFLLLMQIDREVEIRATNYEIGLANGTINKAQQRRRNHERTNSNKS